MKRQPLNYRLNVIGLSVTIFLLIRNFLPSLVQVFDSMTLKIVISILSSLLACFVPVIIMEKMCEFHPALFTKPVNNLDSKDKRSIIGSNMLAFIVIRIVNSLLIILPLEKTGIIFPQQRMPELYSFAEYFLYFVFICICPAIIEEIFLRGMVMNSLMPYGRCFAIFTSAFIFTLMHTTIQSYLPVFVSGILLACIYVYTGDIRLNMIMHFVNNAYSFRILYMDSNVNGISAISFSGFLLMIIIGYGIGSFLHLRAKHINIYSVLRPRETEAKPSRIFKSPVLVLAIAGCLIAARAQTYEELVKRGIL